MNELSNKLLSEICGLKSFFLNTLKDGSFEIMSQLDRKIFYVFENNNRGKIKKRKKG
jgi:hypothetical protein